MNRNEPLLDSDKPWLQVWYLEVILGDASWNLLLSSTLWADLFCAGINNLSTVWRSVSSAGPPSPLQFPSSLDSVQPQGFDMNFTRLLSSFSLPICFYCTLIFWIVLNNVLPFWTRCPADRGFCRWVFHHVLPPIVLSDQTDGPPPPPVHPPSLPQWTLLMLGDIIVITDLEARAAPSNVIISTTLHSHFRTSFTLNLRDDSGAICDLIQKSIKCGAAVIDFFFVSD